LIPPKDLQEKLQKQSEDYKEVCYRELDSYIIINIFEKACWK